MNLKKEYVESLLRDYQACGAGYEAFCQIAKEWLKMDEQLTADEFKPQHRILELTEDKKNLLCALRRVQGILGHPDSSEACRCAISFIQEVLEEYD